MSRDIRSFFTTLSKKTVPSKPDTPNGKKRPITDLNTSDDIIPDTPENVKKQNKNSDKASKRRRIITVSSDSEPESDKKISPKNLSKSKQKTTKDETDKTKQKPTKKLESQKKGTINEPSKPVTKKKISLLEAFGNEPIKQDKPKTELDIHEDDDFDKTLLDLDEDELFQKVESTTKNEEPEKTNKLSVSSDDSKKTPSKNSRISSKNSESSSEKKKTPASKRKLDEDGDTSNVDTDQDRYEKKRYSAMLYQQYLNRSGPAHHGTKWIPKGKPDCLKGLCFIITGVLDSMQREEAQALIVEHGGRCTQSVSGKVNYMVLGVDGGPAKVEKARKLGTKIISEDDLIDLICIKSGIQNQNSNNEPSSENNASQKSSSQDSITKVEKTKSPVKVKQKTPTKVKTPTKKEVISDDENDAPVSTTKLEKQESKRLVKKEQISDDEDEIPVSTVKSKESVQVKTKSEITKKRSPDSKTVPFKPPVKEKIVDKENLAWVDKYKPTDISQIIGQQGDKSNMNKLLRWLQNWNKNRARETSGKGIPKPSPWAKDDDGAYFRAALLSGSPGVGKTTTATLVCKYLGYDTVEFNASDTRNKRMVHDEVAHILNTTSLAGYAQGGAAPTRKHALLMDEVDGMSGNEDRGGIQELITLIKTANVPIICMCNDRQHPKIRTLAAYCFDLRFSKPRVEQIRGAMMSICFKEKLPIKGDALAQIIQGTGQDVRQTLNQLSLLAAGASDDPEKVAAQAKSSQKDTKLGPWEVIRKVFSEEEHKNMSFMDHSKLFFYDYSIGPLFVQENYLKVIPHCNKSKHLERFAQAADAISMGDVIDARIRSTQNWSLLEVQAMYASVIPGHLLRGHMGGQIDFPSWLGKNSKANKFQRLYNEIYAHTRMSTSCDRTSVSLDLAKSLRDAVTEPLLRHGNDGIPAAMETMRAYSLLREDITSLVEVTHWPRSKNPFEQIDSKVKASFTRSYNKENLALPYAVPAAGPVKKRAAANSEEMYGEDEEYIESEEEKDDVNKDGMIKMKKTSKNEKVTSTKPSSSKGKTSSKGRGGKRGK